MKHILALLTLFLAITTMAQNYKTEKNIPYYPESGDAYRNERAQLDIYYPTDKDSFATVVYFHGGGLEKGKKYVPKELKEQGIAVVSPNYRLSPKVQHPVYIEDAAQAVAWAVENIARYGGDPNKIYISGHSAGGYLTLMLALDKGYLEKVGIDADSLAGYVPLTAQTNTHYTIRKERGLNPTIPIIDEYAPIYHSRKLTAPLILVTGDRTKELLARYTENLHLQDVLNVMSNDVPLYELQGFDHGTMRGPGCYLLLELMKKGRKK